MGNTAGKHHPGGRKYVHWDTAVPPAPPGKPHLVPGTPNHQPDLVTISWEPPINDGGAPVTGYQVEHRRTGSPHWVRSTPNLVPVPELTLSGLEPGWRYQFRVSAKNAAGMSEPGDISEPLTVTLNRSAASAPHFVQELHDTIALENETAEFKVHFRGTPTPKIAWYKDGFEIFSSRRMRVVTEGDQSSLVIFQTAFSDEGEIKCTATNRVGHIVTRAKLRLEAPPSIRIPRQYEDGLLFEMGEIIRLKVSVAGRPLPRVTWFHNGEQVMFGGRYEVTNTDRSSSIRVAEARRADRGEYQVRATNRLGEDSASFLVTVTDRPVPPGKAQVVTTLGRSVTLSWSMPEDDGGCKIGNYIVEYYRIGWNVWLKAATCRQLTTTLGDLIEGSEYKFRVKAENPYGVSDPSEESDVVFIPDPKRGLLEPPARKRGSKVDVKAEDKSQQRPGSGRTTPQPVEVKKEVALAGKRKDLEDKLEPPKKGAPDIRLVRSKEWETVDRPVPVIMFDDKKPSQTVKRMNKENVNKNAAENLPKKIKGDEPPPVPPKTSRRPVKTEDQAQKQVVAPVQSKVQVQVQTQDMAVPKTKPVASNTSARKQIQEERRGAGEDNKTTKTSLDNRRRSVDSKVARSHLSPLSPREDDDSIMHGSSELMLVLLPEGESAESHRDERAQSERRSEFGNTFQESESLVAPPMSLSAPELGSGDSAITNPLRNAVSSTELLHEKAMARFYQAVAAEEAEKARQRRENIERPVPSPARGRLASLEDEEELRRAVKTHDLVRGGLSSLEDETELRKNLKGRVLANQRNDKPTSLGKVEEPMVEQKIETQRDIKVNKQLISEEEEQEEFARIRQKLNSREGMKPHRERVRQASEEEMEEDDTEEEDDDMEDDESLDASVEYDDDEDEPYHPRSFLPQREFRPKLEPSFISVERDIHSEDDEEDTYHPRDMTPRQVITFQIAPQPEPNPEVLPKPILKQKKEILNPEILQSSTQETKNLSEPPRDSLALRSSKSPSPSNETGESDVVVRRRKKEPPPLESSEADKTGKEEAQLQDDDVGLSAAEIARKRRLQARQSSLEEEATLQRVVSSHYDDFIREYGRTKKRQIQLFTNTEELKAAVFSSDENVSVGGSAEEPVHSEDVKTSTVLKEYDERWQKLQQKQEELEQKWKKDTPQPIKKQPVEELQFDSEKEPIKKKLDQKPQEPPRQEKNRKEEEKEEEEDEEDYDDEEEEEDDDEEDDEEEEEEKKEEIVEKPKLRWWWQRRQTTEDDQKIATPSPPVAQVKVSPPAPEVERSVSEPDQCPPGEEDKMKVAEKNVRSFIEYVSDLAMFSVAFCLYILENEVLAIPLLILMVYRQVYQAIKRKIPAKWKRSR